MGFWTRANPELCLLATRGKPQRRATDVAKLLIEARREHSRKPDETYERIERLVDGPYLELFARASQPGWDRLGNQAGLFDQGPVRTRRRPSRGPAPVVSRRLTPERPPRTHPRPAARFTRRPGRVKIALTQRQERTTDEHGQRALSGRAARA